MLQLIAIAFFAGLLVALAVLLQMTVRAHWADIASALLGRPMSRTRRRAAATASAPRSRMRRAAA